MAVLLEVLEMLLDIMELSRRSWTDGDVAKGLGLFASCVSRAPRYLWCGCKDCDEDSHEEHCKVRDEVSHEEHCKVICKVILY